MDNSDWTRNGDYHPSRWDSQADAANLIAESKCEKNPENSVGIVSMAGKRVEVHITLTNDLARILNAVKDVKLSQECDFLTSLNISVLTLRHRQNKNQKQRIILFVGSPIKHKVEEMQQIGKKLKKYNIAADIISFGHVEENRPLIEAFLNAINNANNSSMLEVPTGYYILDSLFSSPIMNDNLGENNNFESEINAINAQQPQESNPQQPSSSGQQPNSNGAGMSQFERELQMAIQQSLEEEEKKNGESNKDVKTEESKATPQGQSSNVNDVKMDIEDDEDAELEKARLMSIEEHDGLLKKKEEEDSKNIFIFLFFFYFFEFF